MNDTESSASSRRKGSLLKAKPTLFACVVLAFGLLLWARFILVTGHPRTAIAEPPEPKQIVVQPHLPMPADAPAKPVRDQAAGVIEVGD